MKKICAIVLLAVCSGCGRVKQTSCEANILSGRYVQLMRANRTTPLQDQQHIEAMDREILQLDAALRGTPQAQATRNLLLSTPAK